MNIVSESLPSKDSSVERLRPWVHHFVLVVTLAAILIAIGVNWANAANNMRILMTLGLGLMMQLVATVMWQNPPKRHMSYTLMPISIMFQCAGWWTLLAVIFPAANKGLPLPSIMLAIVLAMQIGLYRLYRLGMLFNINLGLAYSLLLLVLLWLNAHAIIVLVTLGLSMLCLGLSLPDTVHAKQAGVWQFVGGLILFTGCFKWAKGTGSLEFAYFISVLALFFYSVRHSHKGLALVSASAIGQYVIYIGMSILLLTSFWSFTLVILAMLITAMGYGGVCLWRYYTNENRLSMRHYLLRGKSLLRRIIPFSPSHQ